MAVCTVDRPSTGQRAGLSGNIVERNLRASNVAFKKLPGQVALLTNSQLCTSQGYLKKCFLTGAPGTYGGTRRGGLDREGIIADMISNTIDNCAAEVTEAVQEGQNIHAL